MGSGGAYGLPKMPSIGMPKMPSFGMPKMPSFGSPKPPRAPLPPRLPPPPPPTKSSATSTKPTITQIIFLLIFSFLLGTLMFYLHNKQSNVSSIKNGIMIVCVMISAIAITGALHLNINIYDLLISSQINTLCLFLFLSYIGISSFSAWEIFTDLGTYVKDLFSIFTDPTNLYKKGFDIIIPTLFMLIPFIILVTNFIKMSGVNFLGAVIGAIMTALISIIVVYFLWPENLTKPPISKSGDDPTFTSRLSNMFNRLF
jgi:membrane protein YdbS with pleckstrin-like domain